MTPLTGLAVRCTWVSGPTPRLVVSGLTRAQRGADAVEAPDVRIGRGRVLVLGGVTAVGPPRGPVLRGGQKAGARCDGPVGAGALRERPRFASTLRCTGRVLTLRRAPRTREVEFPRRWRRQHPERCLVPQMRQSSGRGRAGPRGWRAAHDFSGRPPHSKVAVAEAQRARCRHTLSLQGPRPRGNTGQSRADLSASSGGPPASRRASGVAGGGVPTPRKFGFPGLSAPPRDGGSGRWGGAPGCGRPCTGAGRALSGRAPPPTPMAPRPGPTRAWQSMTPALRRGGSARRPPRMVALAVPRPHRDAPTARLAGRPPALCACVHP